MFDSRHPRARGSRGRDAGVTNVTARHPRARGSRRVNLVESFHNVAPPTRAREQGGGAGTTAGGGDCARNTGFGSTSESGKTRCNVPRRGLAAAAPPTRAREQGSRAARSATSRIQWSGSPSNSSKLCQLCHRLLRRSSGGSCPGGDGSSEASYEPNREAAAVDTITPGSTLWRSGHGSPSAGVRRRSHSSRSRRRNTLAPCRLLRPPAGGSGALSLWRRS